MTENTDTGLEAVEEDVEKEKKKDEVPFDNKEAETRTAPLINEDIKQLNLNLQASETLGSLMADPDVRKVLEAKRSGQNLIVNVGDADPEPTYKAPELNEEELDDMTPSQLAKKILSMISEATAPVIGQIMDHKLAPISQGLEGVKSYIQGQESKSVQNEITECRGKYTDFSLYESQIVELAKGSGGVLDVEECYLLARRRAGGKQTAPPVTETEKPTSTTSSYLAEDEKREPMGSGFGGFREGLQKALDSEKLDELLAHLPP